MRSGFRVDCGAFNAELVEILKKRGFVSRGEFPQRQIFRSGIADGLVVHIGEVHNLRDFGAVVFERAFEDVLKQISAEIADVREIVDGRSAGVHADIGAVDRFELLNASAESVEEFHAEPQRKSFWSSS